MKRFLLLASLPLVACGAYRLAPALGAGAADGPIAVVTHVDVIPPSTAAGRELLREFARDARKEAGAVRIEVFEELARPNHSTVVEVWADRRAYDAHLAAEPTRAYRARLQPMLGSPFDERLHRPTE